LTRNIIYMKRKLLFGAAFLFVAWAATSCESITGCKFCKNVTYENGTVINSGSETEYCGADLVKKEATPDVPVGSLVTKVECR
jgi:fructose-1,6-bisphosphatase/sedoheptulose 1,7-bisphosphatase-like protein